MIPFDLYTFLSKVVFIFISLCSIYLLYLKYSIDPAFIKSLNKSRGVRSVFFIATQIKNTFLYRRLQYHFKYTVNFPNFFLVSFILMYVRAVVDKIYNPEGLIENLKALRYIFFGF
jgi:hypothetical protein